MAKVTSKLQVTLPKVLAERYGIKPGDEIDWVAAGDVIRVIPPDASVADASAETRLRLFDQATRRQRARQGKAPKRRRPKQRGWTREELYERGRPR